MSNLTASVTTETGRATAAESTISGNLSTETSRATAAEGTLTTSLGNEVTRATRPRAALTTSIATARLLRRPPVRPRRRRASGGLHRLEHRDRVTINSASDGEALDAKLNGGNAFTGGSQVLAPSTTTYSSMNVPVNGAAPSTPNMGDVWLTTNDNHVQFQDKNNATQAIAYLSDITGGTVTFGGNISESQVTGLPTDLSNLTASVTTETGRATAAESTISGSLSTETSRATAAEGTLTTSLGNEVTRATGAETALGTSVTRPTARLRRRRPGDGRPRRVWARAYPLRPAVQRAWKRSRPSWTAATRSPAARRYWRHRQRLTPR